MELPIMAGKYRKTHLKPVQQVLNEMLSKLLNEPVFVTGCGRTDAGVHASEFLRI